MSLDSKRTVAELKELPALTSDEKGAQRVAFTYAWAKAREWMRAKLNELPVDLYRDEAGNALRESHAAGRGGADRQADEPGRSQEENADSRPRLSMTLTGVWHKRLYKERHLGVVSIERHADAPRAW